jgi:hypothetical protein
MIRKRKLRAVFILIFCLLIFSLSLSFGQQASPSVKNKETQVRETPEKVVPSPQNIKEKTAINVFLSWIWVSIFVLIYIIRLKIKEVDRLYGLKYFPIKKK